MIYAEPDNPIFILIKRKFEYVYVIRWAGVSKDIDEVWGLVLADATSRANTTRGHITQVTIVRINAGCEPVILKQIGTQIPNIEEEILKHALKND